MTWVYYVSVEFGMENNQGHKDLFLFDDMEKIYM